MKKEQARSIGLFFLLGFMDERVALLAANRTIAQLKAEFPEITLKNRDESLLPISSIIKACRESWKIHRRQIPRNQLIVPPEKAWVLPSGIDVRAWSRYQMDAADEDVMTLLFSVVLSFEDAELAEGFQTSIGTIRYRLGKGIRQLVLIVHGGVS